MVTRINKMITKVEMSWSFNKFSELTFSRNVWRSVWRIYLWIRGIDCRRKGRGEEGEFSGRDEVALRPIPEGFGVTKGKNKRDQDQEPPPPPPSWLADEWLNNFFVIPILLVTNISTNLPRRGGHERDSEIICVAPSFVPIIHNQWKMLFMAKDYHEGLNGLESRGGGGTS